MKFGLFYELQLPTPWEEGGTNRLFRETLEHVQLGEQLGFDCIWGVEHHFMEDHSLSSATGTWLAAAAALTSRIRIGHGIACATPQFVHPARLAEHIATLDQISDGRVEFGTGESASRMELEAFGLDPAIKRQAWEESVREIASMMAMTPYPGHDGDFFQMPCRNLVPKPYQQPHPPLWVAGKPDLAARHGMGCLGFNALSGAGAKRAVDEYYSRFESECVPIGHSVNPNIAVLSQLHVHRDAEEAHERGKHLRFFGFSINKYYLDGEVRPGRGDSWSTFEEIRDSIPPMGADNPTATIGSVEQVRAHVQALEDAGVDQMLLMHQGGKLPHEQNCESVELFAREIMPEFQDREHSREKQKAERLAPAIDAAMARREWPRELTDDEIPVVTPYGYASFIPSPEDDAELASVSEDTKGALGLN
ncbi:MAG: LLM class flavin-dependent oxidoreductase [Novosphingobium sp.]|nr:LLM class flavin-dependent oxidoreductase [Novosphingobium sp.]